MPGNYSKLVTVVTGQTITASERNNEHDNHINNATPAGVDDASVSLAAMQSTRDPYPGSIASQPTDLAGEIQSLRYVLAQLGGAAQWYIDPETSLAGTVGALSDVATPASTAASLKIRLDHIVSELKRITGNANWYDAVSVTLPNKLSLVGGTMSGNIAMGTNKLTGLAAGSASGDSIRFEQLKIIQVVYVNYSTSAISTSTTLADTGLAATITPTNTANRVLVLISQPISVSAGVGISAPLTKMTLNRAGSDILTYIRSVGYSGSSSNLGTWFSVFPIVYVDSPATTSATIYKTRFARDTSADGGTITVQPSSDLASIVLLEVVT